MNVLVTGATGYLGVALGRELAARGHTLRGLVRRQERVEADHFHVEARRPPSDFPADPPQANDANRLAGELGSDVFAATARSAMW